MISNARRRLLRWPVLLGAAVALVLTGATAASAVVTGRTGTTTTRTAIVTQDASATFRGSDWVNAGNLGIYATDGEIIIATFTAESACYGTPGGWCSIRILVDGLAADPASGSDFAFRHVAASNAWDSQSVTRVRTVAFTGIHQVYVQALSVGTNVVDRLDDWTLVAQASSP